MLTDKGAPTLSLSYGRRLFIIGAFLFGALVLCLPAGPIAAQGVANPSGADINFGLGAGADFQNVGLNKNDDLKSTVVNVINWFLGILGVIAVILLLYAGFLWMTARGNEDQVVKAKLIIRNALIGLAVVFLAWGIVAFVISQLRSVSETGPGDGSGNGGGGGGIGGSAPAVPFTLQEMQTAHFGKTNKEDVALCSPVQSRFNHWLNVASVALSLSDIKAVQTGATPTALPLALTPIEDHVGANVLQLKGAANWPKDSTIEIQIPKKITDQAAATLADCTAAGCNDRGAYYAWAFTTTDKIDTQKPSLVSAYPRLPGAVEGYPDRNVDRSAAFTLNFSEVVDFFSLTKTETIGTKQVTRLLPESVKLEQIESRADTKAGKIIPADSLDVTLAEMGIRFNLNGGKVLEPFAWYRLTINNVKDLCGNPLTEEPVSWVFQTNGNVPGVAFTYPSDGYQFACPATEAFVQFNTSMYDIKTNSCAVDGAHPERGGLVTGGSGVGARHLAAADPPPPRGEGQAAVDTNQFCKRYDFIPVKTELPANAEYSPKVSFRNPANDSQVEDHAWRFTVKAADQCANAPYVSQISPNTGSWGRCLTIAGNNFGPAAARSGSDAYANAGADLALGIKDTNWNENYLTGEFPSRPATVASGDPKARDGILDFAMSVKRNVTLGGKVETLASNNVNFRVPVDDPAYAGACLYNLQPTAGRWGDSVALSGTNFGTTGAVSFTGGLFPAVASSWENALIKTSVPNESQDGLVRVATAQGLSNGLPFDITAGLGGQCVPGGAAMCVDPLICNPAGTCVAPPLADRFEIKNPQPTASCASACANTVISFTTSKNIKPESITPANIQLLQCTDANCAGGTNIPTGVAAPPTPVNRVEFTKTLQPNNWYQVTILGGAGGLAALGGELLAGPAYTWKFKTGSAACAAVRLEMSPSGGILYSGASYEYRARAFSGPTSCSAGGEQVAASFTWSDAVRTAEGTVEAECASPVDENRLSLVPSSSTATATAAVATFVSSDREGHLAWVCARAGGAVAGAAVTLTPRCASNSDCVIGACAAECNQQTKACEPKITGFLPGDGAPGSWVTINGCYLGNDWGEVKIRSTNAIPPDVNFCGNTWSNTQIVAEVAPGSESGPVEVTRLGDGRAASTGQNFFTVSSNVYPAICRVSPNSGRPGREFSLSGKNFGSSRALDNDKITASTTAGIINVIDYKDWGDATIRAVVPAVPAAGVVDLQVIKGAVSSNPVTFNVTTASSSGGAAGPGVADLTVRSYLPGIGREACPAMLVEVEFNGAIDPQSVTPAAFRLLSVYDNKYIPGDLQLYRPAESLSRLRFAPQADLVLSGRYEIILQTGAAGLRSQSGGELVATSTAPYVEARAPDQFVIDFNVIRQSDLRAQAACLAQGLTIEPKDPVFFCAGENSCAGDANPMAGHQRVFTATPLAKNGQPLNWRDAVYNWATSTPQVIDFARGRGSNASTTLFTVLPQNGSMGLTASIPAANLSGTTEVRVALCKNPWPTQAVYFGAPFSETGAPYTNPNKNPHTNFSSFYCRDQGAPDTKDDDLPALDKPAEFIAGDGGRVVPDLIKELFFLQPVGTRLCQGGGNAGQQCAVNAECGGGQCVGKTDAVGIRVLQNPEHYGIKEWYDRQTFTKGNPEVMTIDGYAALRDGRTIYVNAANDMNGSPAGAPIYTNIYLLSFNDGAHADTVNIVNQLASNWRFAVNVDNSPSRDALRRDVKRLADARVLADALEGKGAAAPKLLAGTFQQGLSLSTWPSWSQTLAPDLGQSLPVDPLNKIICVPKPEKPVLDQTTCWDKAKSPLQFQCDGNSHFYLYKYLADSQQAVFQFNLEYGAINDWANLGAPKEAKEPELELPWKKVDATCSNLEYIKRL